jgi:hypothetical protein
MKKILALLVFSSSGLLFGQSIAFKYNPDFDDYLKQSKDTLSPMHYDSLLNRFNAFDAGLSHKEVIALLIGFTAQPAFFPIVNQKSERELTKLNKAGQYELALNEINAYLKKVPVSQQALLEKSIALYNLNQKDSAAFYTRQFRKVMDAMAHTGSGTEAHQAFFALNLSDGQSFITNYLKGSLGNISSVKDKDGNYLEVFELKMKNELADEEIVQPLYFHVNHAILKMIEDENLKKKKKKKK